jgi:hypothetical protein
VREIFDLGQDMLIQKNEEEKKSPIDVTVTQVTNHERTNRPDVD